ncbi:hypothetical protein [Aeromicrobium sp. UC242_57]|uniref:hypothetical protein n=1 Tax=Aeromicrobium sp. UC242_57 TaxID=3374624 RepID=UPI00379A8EF1
MFAPLMLLPTSIPLLAVGMFLGRLHDLACLDLDGQPDRAPSAVVPPDRVVDVEHDGHVGRNRSGAAVVGAVIDAHGASAGFLVPLVCGLAGAAVAWSIRTVD